MNSRLRRTIGLLTAVLVLGLVGSALSLTPAAPAGAASRATVSAVASTDPFEILNLPAQKCLGITAGADDSPAVLWGCNGHPDQHWQWGSCIEGGAFCQLYWVTSNGTHQCLGVSGGSTSPNARVVGWSCLGAGHPDQYWQFNITGLICGSGSYAPMYNAKATGKVLGVAAGSTMQGAAIVIYGYQNTCNNQFWNLKPV
jgi:hypothetical protein